MRMGNPMMRIILRRCLIGVVGIMNAGAESNLSDFSRVMRRWGVDEGLTGARAERVAQTPDGHLWVGAEDGLFRFNGRRFERIDTAAVPGTRKQVGDTHVPRRRWHPVAPHGERQDRIACTTASSPR